MHRKAIASKCNSTKMSIKGLKDMVDLVALDAVCYLVDVQVKGVGGDDRRARAILGHFCANTHDN
jgi:hypothetical protein